MYNKLVDIIYDKKQIDKIAIKHNNKAITYKQLYDEMCLNSYYLDRAKNGRKNIAILLPNSIEYIISYFAIIYNGDVIVPIDIRSTTGEIENVLDYCDIDILITNTIYKQNLKSQIKAYKVIIYNMDDRSIDTIGQYAIMHEKNENKNDVSYDDVVLMLHTSGSVSKPKRVMLTNKSLLANTESIIKSIGLTSEDKTFISLPMYFASANTGQLLTHLYLGASIVINDGVFSPNLFFKIVETEKITNFNAVPSLLNLMLEYKGQYDISSLKIVCYGGASTPKNKIKAIMKKFPIIKFSNYYGQTEASPRVTHLLPQYSKCKIGSAGKPIPGVDLKVVDDKGNEVKNGDVGEIVIKGQNVMKGYYKRQDETEKVIIDGWLHTGDLGWIDNDGFLFIAGRKKNIINFSGINIYPEEVEEILLSISYINDARVYAEKHDDYGEVPVAQLVLNSGCKVDEADIKKHCKKYLSSYKIPHKIYFVKTINKTVTGKIKRGTE